LQIYSLLFLSQYPVIVLVIIICLHVICIDCCVLKFVIYKVYF